MPRRKPTGHKASSGRARSVQEAYQQAKAAQAPPPPPPPPPIPAPPSAVAYAIDQVLASLGGGPDRNAYIAPFDAAEQRARQAHSQAVPAIGQNYERMRGDLGQSQQLVNRDAEQARANMAATQAGLQQQIAQHAAPVLADLASQGNTPALGGLLGAAQAQVGTGQAQLAQQAATQQQLSGNLQAAGAASHTSRLADSQLAEQAAKSNATNTLNQVISALDRQKAEAMSRYADDAQRAAAQRANLQLQKAELADRAAERQRELAERNADPARQLNNLQARDQLDAYNRQRSLPPVTARFSDWGRSNPVATDVLRTIFRESSDLDDAFDYLSELERKQKRKDGNIKHQGKRISVNWLRDRLSELKDYWA